MASGLRLEANGAPRRFDRARAGVSAFVVGLVALSGMLFGIRYGPWVGVFSFPILVLCAIIIVLHAVALRAEGSAKFRD